MNRSKLDDSILAHLSGIIIRDYDDVSADLKELVAKTSPEKVWLPHSCNQALFSIVEKVGLVC